jgi:hypothetical protein
MTDNLATNGDAAKKLKPPIAAKSKRQSFIRLCEPRVDKAIDRIRRIGKLGNRQAYEFDERDVDKIVSALSEAVEQMRQRFEDPKAEQLGFKL